MTSGVFEDPDQPKIPFAIATGLASRRRARAPPRPCFATSHKLVLVASMARSAFASTTGYFKKARVLACQVVISRKFLACLGQFGRNRVLARSF
jgi:hypothetical protein